MTADLQMRFMAFVRSIADACRTCFRDKSHCDDCVADRAKHLLALAIEEEHAKPVVKVDYSLYARTNRIQNILKNANRPLASKEIDLRNFCTPQLKFWTLSQMVSKGIIGKKVKSKSRNKKRICFEYFLKNKKETK